MDAESDMSTSRVDQSLDDSLLNLIIPCLSTAAEDQKSSFAVSLLQQLQTLLQHSRDGNNNNILRFSD